MEVMTRMTVIGIYALIASGAWLGVGMLSPYIEAWRVAAVFAAVGILAVLVGDAPAAQPSRVSSPPRR